MKHLVRYVPLSFFCLFSAKALVTGLNITDVAGLFVLGLIASYYEFKTSEKRVELQEERIQELGNSIIELNKHMEELKTHVSGLKLGTQMRVNNVR